MYGGSGVNGDGNNDRDSRIGDSDYCSESMDSVLDLLPNIYSELNIFLYKS